MESLKGRTLEDQILFANIIHDIAHAYSFEKKEEMALETTPKNALVKAMQIRQTSKSNGTANANKIRELKDAMYEYNKDRLEQCTEQFKDSNYIMGIRYLSHMLKKNIRKQYEAEVDQFKQNSRSMTPEVKQAELIRFDKLESLITISPSIDLLYQGRKSNDAYDEKFSDNQTRLYEMIGNIDGVQQDVVSDSEIDLDMEGEHFPPNIAPVLRQQNASKPTLPDGQHIVVDTDADEAKIIPHIPAVGAVVGGNPLGGNGRR
ncbi:MAG: hypothetical protein HOM96_04635 [Rickettsiales bacterium]|nr:hypothetical protein [Rickettsiales bacterium]